MPYSMLRNRSRRIKLKPLSCLERNVAWRVASKVDEFDRPLFTFGIVPATTALTRKQSASVGIGVPASELASPNKAVEESKAIATAPANIGLLPVCSRRTGGGPVNVCWDFEPAPDQAIRQYYRETGSNGPQNAATTTLRTWTCS